MKVQVLLKDDVENLGKTGDVVNVSAGYARNYLIPNRLAANINASTLQEIEALKKRKAIREMEQKREFEGVAARMAGLAVSISMRVTESGTLYGAVHDHDIVELICAKGFDITTKMLQLSEPLKTLGDHVVTVKLHPEVSTEVKVSIVANDETPVSVEEMEHDEEGRDDY